MGIISPTDNGIPGSGDRRALSTLGLGGLSMSYAWQPEVSPRDSFSVEVFVRMRTAPTRYAGEQTLVAGGDAMLLCEGTGALGCASSYSAKRHVGSGFEIVVMEAQCMGGSGGCFSVAARIQNSGAGLTGATHVRPQPEALLGAQHWHHIALTVGRSFAKLYVNASLVSQAPIGNGQTWDGAQVRVGVTSAAALTGGYLDADVDELAVYPHVLPQVGDGHICVFTCGVGILFYPSNICMHAKTRRHKSIHK